MKTCERLIGDYDSGDCEPCGKPKPCPDHHPARGPNPDALDRIAGALGGTIVYDSAHWATVQDAATKRRVGQWCETRAKAVEFAAAARRREAYAGLEDVASALGGHLVKHGDGFHYCVSNGADIISGTWAESPALAVEMVALRVKEMAAKVRRIPLDPKPRKKAKPAGPRKPTTAHLPAASRKGGETIRKPAGMPKENRAGWRRRVMETARAKRVKA